MMYRALWDRRHEGATRISQWTRRVTDVSECPPSAPDLTMHDTSCLNPIMTLIIWFWYITKPKSSEAGGGESCIVEISEIQVASGMALFTPFYITKVEL